MAGDWIKMRADLFTHPKVVRISSALKADKLRTVGGLMSAWCLFDAHSIDGKLDGYTLETLDAHLGWIGFAEQMVAVQWLTADSQGLELPRFDAHNGQSAKRRAQDNDRKQSVRKMSASQADKMRTREEKRREEKKDLQREVLPDWLPAEKWQDFVDHRKASRKPMTDKARERMLRHLGDLKAKGHDVLALMDTAIRSGWQDVYEPKPAGQFNSPAVPRPPRKEVTL
ncbi:hypothetical protein [Pseudoxanthomonas sp.]|uniref:hypothetical protein n=1 Tax=Pseudoxanthomonas sp. TaxID=1871049 RepID=UPI003F7D05BF